jgi:AcrR family transcriptional regulator
LKSFITRRESIIITAIEIIDELGINNLSLREIAGKQGISDSAIYKHFKNKDEIIHGVLDYYSRYDISLMNTVNEGNLNSKDSIHFFVKSIVEINESYPAISSIVNSFEVLKTDNFIVKKAKDIFKNRNNFIANLIKKGQEQNDIDKNYNYQDLADTITGIERTIILRWRIENYNFPLAERVESALNAILEHC